MLVYLTGVLRSGAHRGRQVSENARAAIRIPQEGSLTIQFAAFDESGAPLPLAGNALALSVARHPGDFPLAIFKPGVLAPKLGPSFATFQIDPADTRPDLVPAGRYAYDVWMTAAVSGARDVLVPASPFVVEPAEGRP